MATIKGMKSLIAAWDNLHEKKEEVREALDEKRAWWEDKSERWQESEAGQEWSDKLDRIEEFLDDLDTIEAPEA